MKKLLLWSSVAMFALAPQFAIADGHESAELASKLEMAKKAVMAAKTEAKKLNFSSSKAKIKAISARKAAEEAAKGTDEEKTTMTKNMSMEADKAAMMAKGLAREAGEVVFMAKNTVMDLEAKMTPAEEVVEEPASEEVASSEETMMVSTHEVVAGDTLWDLARTNYGNALMWPKIQTANEGVVILDLEIGGTLNIPK